MSNQQTGSLHVYPITYDINYREKLILFEIKVQHKTGAIELYLVFINSHEILCDFSILEIDHNLTYRHYLTLTI